MGNKTCDLMKAGKTVLFAFEEAIGISFYIIFISKTSSISYAICLGCIQVCLSLAFLQIEKIAS